MRNPSFLFSRKSYPKEAPAAIQIFYKNRCDFYFGQRRAFWRSRLPEKVKIATEKVKAANSNARPVPLK